MTPRADTVVTVQMALRAAARRLADAGIATPELDAEVLLRHALGFGGDRAALFLRRPEPLPPAAADALARLLERRLAGEPVAYLTGTREFFGLPFAVGPGVLVPRPETELLVEWALGWLAARSPGPAATVLDVGTGSGAIALALGASLPPGRPHVIVGSDVSETALAVAAANRAALAGQGRAGEVALVRGDLAGWCRGPVDLLLANLPYLRPDQLAGNAELRLEPAEALVSGPDGLAAIRRLVADAPRLLPPGGAVGLEIDPAQADTVAALLGSHLPGATVRVRPDLAGLARHVTAELPAG